MTNTKRAGQSTREMAKRRRQSAVWIGIIGIAILIVLGIFLQNASVLGIGGLGVLGLLIFMRIFMNLVEGQVNKKIKLEKRAIRGAKAEEKIGELLAELSEDYLVLNDVESPFGNIDHIVIGKNSGVFLIETKAHGGKVTIDGDAILVNGKTPEKNFITQALQNSYWLRDKIGETTHSKPWITPIVVFTNAFVVSPRPIKGVHVVNKKYLLKMIWGTDKPNAVSAQVWENRASLADNLIQS